MSVNTQSAENQGPSGESNHAGAGLEGSQAALFLIAGPFLTFSCALVPFMLAGVLTSPDRSDYWMQLGRIADLLHPLLGDFIGVAGVIATLLVALAAATNFGRGHHMLDARARFAIAAIVLICVIGLSIVAAGTIVIAVDNPREWVRVLPILLVSWVVGLAGQVVGSGATPQLRAHEAKKVWHARKDRARARGIGWQDLYPKKWKRVLAELLLWGVPVVVWGVIVGVLIATGEEWLRENGPSMFALGMTLFGGNLLVVAGWRVSADVSVSPWARVVQALSIGIVGLAMSVSLAIVVITSSTVIASFGWWVLGASAVTAVVVAVPWVRRWIWPMAIIEQASTIGALRRVRAWRDRMVAARNAEAPSAASAPLLNLSPSHSTLKESLQGGNDDNAPE